MSLFGELRRRNVFRVGAAYAVVSWLTLQIADVLLPTFAAPGWVMQTLVVFLAVGFVAALILAWAFDLTPEGVRPTHVADSESRAPAYRSRASDVVLGLVVLAVGYLMIQQFVLDAPADSAAAPADRSAFATKPARLTLRLPEGTWLAIDSSQPAIAMSPDGTRIAFVAYEDSIRHLFVRAFADAEAQRIVGSEGAAMPFFSADGESIGFASSYSYFVAPADGGVAVRGRPTTGAPVSRGAAWLASGEIIDVESANSGLRIGPGPLEGMGPNLTKGESAQLWPSLLPDPGQVLFTDNTAGDISAAVVSRLEIANGTVTPLVVGGTGPHFSYSGHILYGRSATLYAVAYDAATGEVGSSEQSLVEGVAMDSGGAVQFALGNDGTLAYVPGELNQSAHELVLVDRSGNATVVIDDGGEWRFPRLSPDGSMLAVTRPTGATIDVWSVDFRRNNLLTRWTEDFGEDFGAAWSPNSRRIAYSSESGLSRGDLGPTLTLIGGPGAEPESLQYRPGDGDFEIVADWSPDGRYILYNQYTARSAVDLYYFDTGTREVAPFAATSARETAGRFSPDGAWVAYSSNRSGGWQVYVDSFPETSNAVQVSSNGGDEPVWSPDGDELFYREGDRLMRVAVSAGSELELSAPEALFSGRYLLAEGDDQAHYDIAADGEHFYMIRPKNPAMPTGIEIVFNWPEVLGAP